MILTNGYATLITFGTSGALKVYEIDTTPPGVEVLAAIDTTTMRNTAFRTSAPALLKKLSQVKATVAYDTTDLATIQAAIGVNQLITVSYPTGASIAFYGFIQAFTPSGNSDGKRPDASITIEPTLRNASTFLETAPVYVTGS